MKERLAIPIVILLVGGFVLSSGCISSSRTLKNGQEEISVEIGEYYYSDDCEDGVYCKLYIPVKLKNVGRVATRAGISFEVFDYAGVYHGRGRFDAGALYPNYYNTGTAEIQLDLYDKKWVSHDLNLIGTFGKDSVTWRISTDSIRE